MKKEKPIFEGSAVELITPFNEKNKVNYSKLKELIDFQVRNCTDAIIASSATGESSTLSYKERLKVIEETIKHAKGKVPVIAGNNSNDTRDCIRLSENAISLGVDGLLLDVPRTSQEGIIAHFNEVFNKVPNARVILCNDSNFIIQPNTYNKLFQMSNIVAMKQTVRDLEDLKRIKDICVENLDIYAGSDEQIADIMSFGGKGSISIMANVLPVPTHFLSSPSQPSGTIFKLQEHYYELIKDLFIEINPVPIKAIMNMLGMKVGECRLPLVRMNQEKQKVLIKTVRKYVSDFDKYTNFD